MLVLVIYIMDVLKKKDITMLYLFSCYSPNMDLL